MIKELRKKNMMCIFMCLFLMLAGGMLLCGCQKEQTESAVSTEEVKLEQGQYFVYGQIVSINGNEMTYYVTEEETVTVQIPVGTKVTTRLGTETTFSRLAAGDNIKMLIQENDGQEEIMEIWIVD